jgi:G3E family GTPase
VPRIVAANIVTGFLGSGKTTLLRSVLERGLAGSKVAVIVNDFAHVGIDGTVLRGLNVDQLVELPSGCVCCTIGSRFALAIQEILDTVQPHLIVIETSGVAEPAPVISELDLVGVRTDAVIATIDAESVERHCRLSVAALRQVEAADFLVINKTDLVPAAEVRRIGRLLRRMNERALQIPTVYGRVQADLLFATGAASYWRRSIEPRMTVGPRAHLEQDEISAFSFRKNGLMVRERFETLLLELPTDIYRAKGIVKFVGDGWNSVFNYTLGRWRVDWLAPAPGEHFDCRGVFIGRHLAAHRENVLRRIEDCLESTE